MRIFEKSVTTKLRKGRRSTWARMNETKWFLSRVRLKVTVYFLILVDRSIEESLLREV